VRVEEMGAVKEESFNLCTVGLRFFPDICAKLVGLSCLLPVLDRVDSSRRLCQKVW